MVQGHYAFQGVLLGYCCINNVVLRVRVSFSFAKPLEVIGNDGQTLSLPKKIETFNALFSGQIKCSHKKLSET